MSKKEILNTLQTLYDKNDVIEIRIIEDHGKNKSGYYDYEHFDKLADDASKLNGLPGIPGIYITVNPVQRILLARSHNKIKKAKETTTDSQTKYRKYIPFDIDPVRPAGVSSTDKLHEQSINKAYEIKEWLKNKGFPNPIVADSGNGAHLLYRINEPNTQEAKELVESVQKAVIEALNYPDQDDIDIQGFANASRIWKLYGTIAKKGEEIPDQEIRHRTSKILEVPDDIQVVTTKQLKAVATLYKSGQSVQQQQDKPQHNKQTNNNNKFDIKSWMNTHNIKVIRTKKERGKTIYVLETCPLNPEHTGNKEAVIIQEESGKLGFKCHHNSCANKHWSDVRETYDHGYKEKKNNSETQTGTPNVNPAKSCKTCRFFNNGVSDKHGELKEWGGCGLLDKYVNPHRAHLEICQKWEPKITKKKTKEQKEKIDIISPYFIDGEFVPKILGDVLLNEHDILTVSDSRDSAIYQHGVYVLEGADDIIRKIILDKLELDFKRTHVNEVVEYIKLNTLTSREVINRATFKINVMNGMYDVKNNTLLPHSPEYLSTIQLPITYDPDAQCTQIHKFLHEVVDPDDVLVLVQYAGYCCIPDISHQKSLLLDGLAANGKSTFIDLVCTMVGQENVSEQSLQDLNNDKYSSAQLNGKLINMFSDLPRTKLGDNSAFKMLTSDKWIDGEEKYKRKFRFKNTIHQIYSANNIPEVDDPDELAFFRRWICITFPNSFIGRENKHLLSEITTDEELSGFFNISMVALRSLIDNDEFCYNKSVSDVQKIYLLKSDPVQSFLDDCTEVSDFNLPKKELYGAFCIWCEDNTILTTVKDNSFGRKMKKLGYESWRMTDTSRTHVWLNVGLISFPEQNNSYDFNDSCNLSRFGENQEKTWTRKKESIDSDKKSSCPGSQVNIPIVDIYARAYVRGKGFVSDNLDMGVKPTKTRNQAECPGSKNNLDITRTECTKDQRTRIKDVMDIILDIQSSTDNKANRSDIKAAAEDVGIHDTDIILKHMATEGRILQHSDDIFQVI